MKNIIPRLEVISKENNNMGILSRYLLDYQGDFTDLKISKICDDLYISVASATRLAKRLDLDGFTSLKIYLAEENVRNKTSMMKYHDITAQKYYDDIMKSLSVTLGEADNHTINEVSYHIKSCKKVNFFAVGGSNIVITDLAQKLARIKIPVTYHSDPHVQFVEAANTNKGEVCLGLSYSGLTHEILANLQQSKTNGAITVLITNNKNINYQFLDYVIDISSTDNSMRTFSISSRFSALAILDLIYLNIIDSDLDYYNKLLESNRYIK